MKHGTVKQNPVKLDTVKQNTVTTPRQEQSRAAADASSSFIPDDAPLASSELPPDFWGDPPEDERGDPSHMTANDPGAASKQGPSKQGTPSAPGGAPSAAGEAVGDDRGGASGEPTAPATTLSTAFDQLQVLFPGRVLEVTSPAEEATPSVDDDLPPLGDETLGHDGYDDDDQDRLTFGASRDV